MSPQLLLFMYLCLLPNENFHSRKFGGKCEYGENEFENCEKRKAGKLIKDKAS